MQSLNSEQGPRICSALKQTLWGSPWEEMKHQLKIFASPGPVSIPAKGHPGTSFSCMNPHRTSLTSLSLLCKQTALTESRIQPCPCLHMCPLLWSLSSKGDRAGKGGDNLTLTSVLVNGKRAYFSKHLRACFTHSSSLSLSLQPLLPPDQLALLGDPFFCAQVPFVQRGDVPASTSITLWNVKLFPTRFNIRTMKYLKIKGFLFPPPPLSTLQSCSNSVSLHHWTLLSPSPIFQPIFPSASARGLEN